MKQKKHQVKDQEKDRVKDQVKDQVKHQVKDRVKDRVKDQVKHRVKDQVKHQVKHQVKQRMIRILYGLILSFQFFSRLPLPVQAPWENAVKRWALRFLPFVGLAIGSMLFLTALLVQSSPLIIVTALLLSGWLLITGGLHLDGWMDVADALGSQASREKKWKIMKDPHVGSFAVLSVFLLLFWKAVLLYLILEHTLLQEKTALLLFSFLLIPFLSRVGGAVLLLGLPLAKKEGLAWEWRQNRGKGDWIWLAFCLGVILIPSLLLGLIELLVLVSTMAVFFTLFGFIMIKSFGGINGDMIGASIEGGEVWGLLVIWSCIWFVTV